MASPYFRLERRVLLVSGPDARSFLQGLLTQDMDRLPAEDGQVPHKAVSLLYSAMLSPQGKIIADMFVWPARDGGAMLDLDWERANDILRRLTMYKLRADVSITDISDQLDVVVSKGAEAGQRIDPRRPDGHLGYRGLMETEISPIQIGACAWHTERRIALGIPDLAVDAAPEEVFALEALFEELQGVDFQKGCFVGQENVSRMKRRATTRRKFCPIVFEGPTLPFGAPILAGEATLGSVRSGREGRALALLRLDRALEAVAKGEVLTAEGRPVRLDPPDWLILPQAEAQG